MSDRAIRELFENPILVEANPIILVKKNKEFADLEFLFKINGNICRMREVVLASSDKYDHLEEYYKGFTIKY